MHGDAGRTPELEPVRTGYKRWLPWLYSFLPAMFGAIGFLAWRQDRIVQWLAVAILSPAIIAVIWWRTGRAALWIDGSGRLHRRGARRQQADLHRLQAVFVSGSVPYPDQHAHERYKPPPPMSFATQFTFYVEDADGGRVMVAPAYTWIDEKPLLHQIIAVLAAGGGRCDPLCWEYLHLSAGLDVPPYPERLQEPPADAGGQPLRIRRIHEAAMMTRTRYLAVAAFLLSGGLSAIFSPNLVLAALNVVIGGVLFAVVWLLTDRAVRRSGRDVVRIGDDGHLTATTRRAWSGARLGYRLSDGAVDLRRLRRARFVAGTRCDAAGLPLWWNLELDDEDGGHATIDLFHRREPEATMYPQLATHLEAVDLPLDARTHDGLSARLGRPLTNPRTG